MNNVFTDQIILLERVEGLKLWNFTTGIVRKTDDRFRLTDLVDGGIVWLKPAGIQNCWEVAQIETYTAPQALPKPVQHICQFNDRVEFDEYGRVFMFCLCGNHKTHYLPNNRLTEIKKEPTRTGEREPANDLKPFFKAFVWSDLDFKTGIWLNLSDRGDGFFQGYLDNPNAHTFDKYVVMRVKDGRYVINHPHSRKEHIRTYLPQTKRTDYIGG